MNHERDASELRGSEAGICFVAGSGPSLYFAPTHLFPVIAVNGAILKFRDAEWFFTCDARVTLKTSWDALRSLRCRIMCNCKNIETYMCDQDVPIWDGIDPDRVYIRQRQFVEGTSSAHNAVMFAAYLGYDPIVLLGMDCAYSGRYKRFTDYPDEPEEKYIKPQYSEYAIDDFSAGACECAWPNVTKAIGGSRTIINCSGGVLTEFPRLTLEEVLDEYGKGIV